MLERLVRSVGLELWNGPATPSEIAEAEAAFGSLPAVLRAIWSEHAGSEPLRSDGLRFLSPADAVDAWRAQLDYVREEGLLADQYVFGAIHWKVFDARWIPFAADGDRDHLYCLDGYPSAQGTLDQVICVHHLEGPSGGTSKSLEAFIGGLAGEVEAAHRTAVAATEAASARQKALRPAVETELSKYREAGVDLGGPDELAEDPTFAIGQGSTWTPAVHATRLFLTRAPGLSFRGVAGTERWATRAAEHAETWTAPSGLGAALTSHVRSLESSWDRTLPAARGDLIAIEANRLLEAAQELRRLYAPSGKGTPYSVRYVLLTPEQKSALEAAGLVQFRSLAPPASGGAPRGGMLERLRRFLS